MEISIKLIVAVIVILIVILLGLDCLVFIGPGERGVVTRMGAVQDEIKDEGLNVIMPFIEKVIVCLLYTSPSPRDRS